MPVVNQGYQFPIQAGAAVIPVDVSAARNAANDFIQVAQTGRLSPPVRQTGQVYAPNGVNVGMVQGEPVNKSAQPVIGGYSPYGTMLYASRRTDNNAAIQDIYRKYVPRAELLYNVFRQALNQRPVRTGAGAGGGGGGGGGVGAAAPAPAGGASNVPVVPPKGNAVPGRMSTADDYGIVDTSPSIKVGGVTMPVNPDLDYNFDSGNRGIFQERSGIPTVLDVPHTETPIVGMRRDPYESDLHRNSEVGGKIDRSSIEGKIDRSSIEGGTGRSLADIADIRLPVIPRHLFGDGPQRYLDNMPPVIYPYIPPVPPVPPVQIPVAPTKRPSIIK